MELYTEDVIPPLVAASAGVQGSCCWRSVASCSETGGVAAGKIRPLTLRHRNRVPFPHSWSLPSAFPSAWLSYENLKPTKTRRPAAAHMMVSPAGCCSHHGSRSAGFLWEPKWLRSCQDVSRNIILEYFLLLNINVHYLVMWYGFINTFKLSLQIWRINNLKETS